MIGLITLGWAACGDGPSELRVKQASAPPEWSALAKGPLDGRRDSAVVWAGDRVLVIGGEKTGSPGVTRNDGVAYVPASRRWVGIRSAPFSPPLYRPAAVWDGAQAVVIGTPCTNAAPSGGAAPLCTPGGYAAATYDASTDSWRLDPLPPELARERHTGAGVEAIGAVDGTAYFRVGQAIWAHSAGWTRVAEAPVAMRRVCATDHGLIAADYWDEAWKEEWQAVRRPSVPGQVALIDGGGTAPIGAPRVSVYSSGQWSAVSTSPDALGAPDHLPVALGAECDSSGLTVYPGMASHARVDAWRFDAMRATWERVPKPPSTVGPVPHAARVGEALVLFGSDGAASSRRTSTGNWTDLGKVLPTSPRTAIGAGSAAIAVVQTTEGLRLVALAPTS